MTIQKIVGDNIRFYRTQCGWPQEKLAIRSTLSSNYVSALERGTVNISVYNLEKIAKALKIEPAVLLVKEAYTLPKELLQVLNEMTKKQQVAPTAL
jgi:transcriptional regulator with XRE-family HTH domain